MRRFFAGSLIAAAALAQAPAPKPKLDPVKWSLRLEPATAAPGQKILGHLTATIDPGWHLYSLTTPKPPIATTIQIPASPAVVNWTVWAPPPKRAFDPNFQVETETYEEKAEFLLEMEVQGSGSAEVTANVRYQSCDNRQCLPPVRRSATAILQLDPAARTAAPPIPPGYNEFKPPAIPAAVTQTPAKPGTPSAAAQGLGQFIAVALGFGFLAVFTPCVFPMIPITMSYFLNAQTTKRSQSIVQALTFCVGVIVFFTGLGAIVTAALGPFGLTQLGSNVWVNLFIGLVFVAFGLSLLGAFEITVPSGVLTAVTTASYRGGLGGVIIMGLAFALASFACTGPFIGTLLAGSTQGGIYWPVLGMFFFATGLASPFFFLALFPAYLARLPKSGGWLDRTKVTLGFLILAAAVKYLSNIDQVYQWNILTRARFLATWIVMLALAGLYLLGILKIKESKDEPVSLPRLFAGAVMLVLAVSLIPGMFGVRLGEIDAYVPQAAESGLAGGGGSELKWIKDNYKEALDTARQSGKPVFVSFTGYACTNCHWMETNMFTRPEIASALKNYVLVKLYTDGSDPASEANQKMEESRFSTIAIPFYALIRPDDTVIDTFTGSTRDAREFEGFLSRGAPAPASAAPSS